MRSALLYKKFYMVSCYETLCRLCWCGLLQFNKKKYSEKDQLLIYVNRNAILYDTTTSSTGYHQVGTRSAARFLVTNLFVNQVARKDYKRMSYRFAALTDVEQYWYQLWSISMNTPLGYRSSLSASVVNIENVRTKREMIEATSSRNHRTAVVNDVG